MSANRIATNFHVIETLDEIYVKFADGTVEQVQRIVQGNKNLDLAVLEVQTRARSSIPLGDELVLHEGDPVLAIGAPKGLELTLTSGIVSSFRRDENSFLIQTTAPIAPGSSGGPLLDAFGRVVEITVSTGLKGSQFHQFKRGPLWGPHRRGCGKNSTSVLTLPDSLRSGSLLSYSFDHAFPLVGERLLTKLHLDDLILQIPSKVTPIDS